MHKCPKCRGCGKVPFLHIQNGKCFDCNGTGKVEYNVYTKDVERFENILQGHINEYRPLETELNTIMRSLTSESTQEEYLHLVELNNKKCELEKKIGQTKEHLEKLKKYI